MIVYSIKQKFIIVILGHKVISMLVEVYGHTLQEKINEEFDNVRKLL